MGMMLVHEKGLTFKLQVISTAGASSSGPSNQGHCRAISDPGPQRIEYGIGSWMLDAKQLIGCHPCRTQQLQSETPLAAVYLGEEGVLSSPVHKQLLVLCLEPVEQGCQALKTAQLMLLQISNFSGTMVQMAQGQASGAWQLWGSCMVWVFQDDLVRILHSNDHLSGKVCCLRQMSCPYVKT